MPKDDTDIRSLEAGAVQHEFAVFRRIPGNVKKHHCEDDEQQRGELYIPEVVRRSYVGNPENVRAEKQEGKTQAAVVDGSNHKHYSYPKARHPEAPFVDHLWLARRGAVCA